MTWGYHPVLCGPGSQVAGEEEEGDFVEDAEEAQAETEAI